MTGVQTCALPIWYDIADTNWPCKRVALHAARAEDEGRKALEEAGERAIVRAGGHRVSRGAIRQKDFGGGSANNSSRSGRGVASAATAKGIRIPVGSLRALE